MSPPMDETTNKPTPERITYCGECGGQMHARWCKRNQSAVAESPAEGERGETRTYGALAEAMLYELRKDRADLLPLDGPEAIESLRAQVATLMQENAKLFVANATLTHQAERTKAEERDRWSLALQSLTPGGSEYVDDPERCVQFVRSVRESQHASLATAVRLRKGVEAELAALRSQSEGVDCEKIADGIAKEAVRRFDGKSDYSTIRNAALSILRANITRALGARRNR